jgi:hypothetical protein
MGLPELLLRPAGFVRPPLDYAEITLRGEVRHPTFVLPISYSVEIQSVSQRELLLRQPEPFAQTADVDIVRSHGCNRTAGVRKVSRQDRLALDLRDQNDGTPAVNHFLHGALGAQQRKSAFCECQRSRDRLNAGAIWAGAQRQHDGRTGGDAVDVPDWPQTF